MSDIALLGIILGGMLVTYTQRLSFIALIPPERLPATLHRGLRLVPPAVLAAVILPEVMRPVGPLDLSLQNHRLLAGCIAALVAWRFRNAWLTIAAGMLALWLLSLL
jgi:branched-subunit amino acid transport protein